MKINIVLAAAGQGDGLPQLLGSKKVQWCNYLPKICFRCLTPQACNSDITLFSVSEYSVDLYSVLTGKPFMTVRVINWFASISFNSLDSTLVLSLGMLRSISLKWWLPSHIEIRIKIFHLPPIVSSVSLTGNNVDIHSWCSIFFISFPLCDYPWVTGYLWVSDYI